jgi:hypothetical protein
VGDEARGADVEARGRDCATVRRTHYVFLAVDGLLIWYGFWMLRAAEESARHGGGLLGGLGLTHHPFLVRALATVLDS